ncbi:MAG TPA: phosphoribosylformylglycinamidine synthase subunit PurL [Vicinamibacteria bacterium]|nr:phosphoribosylformylglycinamidine synthase subunit PurL [Vicinamibacteria bacterium]
MNDEQLKAHDLTRSEYDAIVQGLGREPNAIEIGLFSVMWSEHCSYKSSRIHLKNLPTEGPRVVQGPGENAGVVDIGEGLACVFKIESHNHPSFIEPFQGAATGVGGIIRDVFTMGARPIALMNSLRFGPLSVRNNRSLLSGVVAGIASYGNSMGIPTVGGEVVFEDCYSANPLVNAFCLGIAPKERIFLARASGEGNPVFYVGAKTGKDGIHGATMASAEFSEGSEEKRPTVQVGDPFLEKLLLEACLELMQTDALVAIQDMGAAGLTCSSAEMGARGGTGIEIDLDKVPRREAGMSAYETLLSESQERMLLVARAGREPDVKRIFDKWDLDASAIGRVTSDGLFRVFSGKLEVASVPCRLLAEDAPMYRRPAVEPPPSREMADIDEPGNLEETLLQLLGSHTVASKHWIFEQYDHMVRSNTIGLPGGDAGVVRIKGTELALAVCLDGHGRYTQLDPYLGGAISVAEACRNLAAVGATPIGATNCLNFGNPEKPEIMGQFVRAIEGIGEACNRFGVPITGGNVSFYNETEGAAIYPTPVIGVVGLLENASKRVSHHFKRKDDLIFLLGDSREELGGSEYLKVVHRRIEGKPPRLDWDAERAVHDLAREAARQGLVQSAHDVSDGGLLVALVECLFGPLGESVGASVALETPGRADTVLFSETQGRILVSVSPGASSKLETLAETHGVPLSRLGVTGGDQLVVRVNGDEAVSLGVARLRELWWNSIEKALRA